MLSPGAVRAFAIAHLVIMLIVGGCWLVNQLVLYSAVEEMSDELANRGVLDADKMAALRADAPSPGNWLMQGWDRRALAWGVGVCAVGLAGSAGLLVLGMKIGSTEGNESDLSA